LQQILLALAFFRVYIDLTTIFYHPHFRRSIDLLSISTAQLSQRRMSSKPTDTTGSEGEGEQANKSCVWGVFGTPVDVF